MKQVERNDKIYRENLRIYSNINDIMNRRSNSVTLNDRERGLMQVKTATKQPDHYFNSKMGSSDLKKDSSKTTTSRQNNKNYFTLRNKGIIRLKLNPINRQTVIKDPTK
jgi:hypothetical protein